MILCTKEVQKEKKQQYQSNKLFVKFTTQCFQYLRTLKKLFGEDIQNEKSRVNYILTYVVSYFEYFDPYI